MQKFCAEFLQLDTTRLEPHHKKLLSRKLAEIFDSVNYLHPFREGNGRTQREFLRLLALEKGWKLNLNPPDNVSVYERYMEGTISGNIDLLDELIFECLSRKGLCNFILF